MLMSADLPLPGKVFGHGFLTRNGQKISKTLGNTIDPFELVSRYGTDAIRYYFLKEIDLGQDGDFNETRFVNIVNAELADDLGNLLNRTLKMVQKYCNAQVPNCPVEAIPADHPLKVIGLELGDRVAHAYETLHFSQAANAILTLMRSCNKFIDEQAPWALYKQGKQEALEQVLYTVLESVRLAAYLLSPLTPNISSEIYKQLGFSINFNDKNHINDLVPFSVHAHWGTLPPNQNLGEARPVFPRLELP